MFPYGALRILAHDSRQLRCFVGLGLFSLSSPSAFLWPSKSDFIQARPRRGCVCGGLVAVPAEPREAPGLVTPQGVPAVPWPMCSCRLAERGSGREGLSWTGRPTGTLAPGRLGAAWHWAQPGQLSHSAHYQAATAPRHHSPADGLQLTPQRHKAFVVAGFLLLFLFPWLIFGFFNLNKQAINYPQ